MWVLFYPVNHMASKFFPPSNFDYFGHIALCFICFHMNYELVTFCFLIFFFFCLFFVLPSIG